MSKKHLKVWGLILLSMLLVLAACGQAGDGAGADEGEEAEDSVEESGEDEEATEDEAEAVSIGITQIVEHPSLDAAREGFKQALEDHGYIEGETVTYDEQNAQNDQATATSIADKFASDGVDLILAIATPTAQATAQAITDIPILITAVTEPQEAGLVDSWESPGGNVTGTSDLNPVADQLELLTEIAPDAETVGIVYSSGEVNSEVQVEKAEEVAPDLGLELELVTVSNTSEVLQAVESLSHVDALYVPTDNTVVEGLESVIQVAEAEQIPVIVGEGDSVERGGIATWGINYEQLGYQTGEMAVRILEEGADPATMPIEELENIELIVNTQAAEKMGVEIPQSVLDKADQIIE